MREHGYSQVELTRRLNSALEEITGRPADVSDRTVWNLVHGKSHRPIGRTCAALELVFGCPVGELGLTAPSITAQEGSVRRRRFFTSAAGVTAAAAAPTLTPRRAVGMSDVARVADAMNVLVEADDRLGGHAQLERDALAGRENVLQLQKKNASERVHRALFALAAEYTTIAAWSCIDVRDLDRAQQHLQQSAMYASMSQDAPTEMRVWIGLGMLAHQRRNWTEAVAAARVAQRAAASRRDPFFGSMGHARVSLAHSRLRDQRAALRALGAAEAALGKATAENRPRWTAFYGPAELEHIAAVVCNSLGEPDRAEARAHSALAKMPEAFRRNRALVTATLAIAQLKQGEIERATTTAGNVFTIMGDAPLPGRMRTLIGDFHRGLNAKAPTATYTRDWTDRMRAEWSRA